VSIQDLPHLRSGHRSIIAYPENDSSLFDIRRAGPAFLRQLLKDFNDEFSLPDRLHA
jgi:hypothetical protein